MSNQWKGTWWSNGGEQQQELEHATSKSVLLNHKKFIRIIKKCKNTGWGFHHFSSWGLCLHWSWMLWMLLSPLRSWNRLDWLDKMLWTTSKASFCEFFVSMHFWGFLLPTAMLPFVLISSGTSSFIITSLCPDPTK